MMSDSFADMTDAELQERLGRFGVEITTKGRMTEAQRQIQKKKLNHLEAKERADREKAERQAAKRTNDDSEIGGGSKGLAKKRARGGARRKTVAVVTSGNSDDDDDDDFGNAGIGDRRDDPNTSVRSLLGQRDTIALSKNASSDSSPLIIHLVDTHLGHAAAGVPVILSVLHATKGWFQLAERETNIEGECPGLITKDLFQTGFYRVKFNTEEYYKRTSIKVNFPEIEVGIHVEDSGERYAVSILLMSNGYTATVVKNARG